MNWIVLLSLLIIIVDTTIAFVAPSSSFNHNHRVDILKPTSLHKSTSLDAFNIKLSLPSHEMLVDFAYIGVGAVTGACARYQIGNIVNRKIAESHPRFAYYSGWHTAGINMIGSFVLGTLAGIPTITTDAAAHDSRGITARTRLMCGVGFCGSFTTFSTFSVDIVAMLNKGEVARAFSYMAVNNVGGVCAAFAGFSIARKVLSKLK